MKPKDLLSYNPKSYKSTLNKQKQLKSKAGDSSIGSVKRNINNLKNFKKKEDVSKITTTHMRENYKSNKSKLVHTSAVRKLKSKTNSQIHSKSNIHEADLKSSGSKKLDMLMSTPRVKKVKGIAKRKAKTGKNSVIQGNNQSEKSFGFRNNRRIKNNDSIINSNSHKHSEFSEFSKKS
jgi:hypothetical protein